MKAFKHPQALTIFIRVAVEAMAIKVRLWDEAKTSKSALKVCELADLVIEACERACLADAYVLLSQIVAATDETEVRMKAGEIGAMIDANRLPDANYPRLPRPLPQVTLRVNGLSNGQWTVTGSRDIGDGFMRSRELGWTSNPQHAGQWALNLVDLFDAELEALPTEAKEMQA